jgi:hypothetical protein
MHIEFPHRNFQRDKGIDGRSTLKFILKETWLEKVIWIKVALVKAVFHVIVIRELPQK